MDPVMIVLLSIVGLLLISVIVELICIAKKKKQKKYPFTDDADAAVADAAGPVEETEEDHVADEKNDTEAELESDQLTDGETSEISVPEAGSAADSAATEESVGNVRIETSDEKTVAETSSAEKNPPVSAKVQEKPVRDFPQIAAKVPKKPFYERMLEADDETQAFYNELRNEFKSYRNVNARISKGYDSFRKNRQLIARLYLSGGTIKLYLKLNAAQYETGKYHQQFVGDKKTYAEIPMMVKVKSRRALLNAKALIADLMKNEDAAKKLRYARVDYIKTLRALMEND